MKQVKINFADFWKGFDKENNFFSNLLRKRFEIEIAGEPDLLIYGCYGQENLKYSCAKLFFISENVRPNYSFCDFSFSFDYGLSPKNYRLPLYLLYDDIHKLVTPKDVQSIQREKTRFCNFIYSNSKATERINFFNLLNEYKKVDSAGRILNNIGQILNDSVQDKLEFIRHYKFTIAFENSSYPGYTTEKIFQPMLVNSIPIYWGNPLIRNEFNVNSFINVHDYNSHKMVVDRVMQLDQDDRLYAQYQSQPYFIGNMIPEILREDKILDRFEYILNSIEGTTPVSNTISGYFSRGSALLNPYLAKVSRRLKQSFSK